MSGVATTTTTAASATMKAAKATAPAVTVKTTTAVATAKITTVAAKAKTTTVATAKVAGIDNNQLKATADFFAAPQIIAYLLQFATILHNLPQLARFTATCRNLLQFTLFHRNSLLNHCIFFVAELDFRA